MAFSISNWYFTRDLAREYLASLCAFVLIFSVVVQVQDPGGSPSGWFDFVSCCLESSATPLLDLQSDPAMKGYYQGLQQVVIRDYMM